MSSDMSFGCIICNSKMEFIMMNNSAGSYRDNIYGRSDDSSVKNESFSKISEKSMTTDIMNFSNYVD